MAKVRVYPARDVPEEPIVFEGVTQITYVDNDSHGQGPVGSISDLRGGKRLIISSPNSLAVLIEA